MILFYYMDFNCCFRRYNRPQPIIDTSQSTVETLVIARHLTYCTNLRYCSTSAFTNVYHGCISNFLFILSLFFYMTFYTTEYFFLLCVLPLTLYRYFPFKYLFRNGSHGRKQTMNFFVQCKPISLCL